MKVRMVKLKSFLGATEAPADTEHRENYWQLIGKSGEVIAADENHDGRVLVVFADNLDDYGLENHNPVKNSLWIRLTDLAMDGE